MKILYCCIKHYDRKMKSNLKKNLNSFYGQFPYLGDKGNNNNKFYH